MTIKVAMNKTIILTECYSKVTIILTKEKAWS